MNQHGTLAVYRTGAVLETAYADCSGLAPADVSGKPEYVGYTPTILLVVHTHFLII